MGLNPRLVVYHSQAWADLVEQGWYTARVYEEPGITWAYMIHKDWRGWV